MAAGSNARYVKVKGGGRPSGVRGLFSGAHTLWLGDDHLLVVENHGFRERYKRLRFADIQALVVTSRSRTPFAIALLVAGALLALPTLAFDDATAAALWAVFCVVPFAVALLVHLVRGPLVTCTLQTAVQVEPLPSLGRRRTLDKALARLVPRIEASQGRLTEEALAEALAAAGPRAAAPVRHAAPLPEGTKGAPYRGHAHAVLFLFLLASSVVRALMLVSQSVALDVASTSCLLGALIALVVGASRHADPFVTQALRTATWTALGVIVPDVYAIVLLAMVRGTFMPGHPLAELVAATSPTLRAVVLVWMTITSAVAIAGLVILGSAAQASRRAGTGSLAGSEMDSTLAPMSGPPTDAGGLAASVLPLYEPEQAPPSSGPDA